MSINMDNGKKSRPLNAASDDRAFRSAIEHLRRRDREGYTELFSSFSRPLAAHARALGTEDPDEIVNRVFVTAFGSAERIAGGRLDFISFLYTLSSFEIEDAKRNSTSGFTGSTDGRAEALMSLTRAQREVLCLQVFFGLRPAEVATATGNTVRTVRWLRDRANSSLKAAATTDTTPTEKGAFG
jgi:DNA-directed RNA polymerase specialized sigma24 family protein